MTQAKKSILQRRLGGSAPRDPAEAEAAVRLGHFEPRDKLRAVHSLLSHDFFVDKLLEFIDLAPQYVFEAQPASLVLAKACADLARAPSASELTKARLSRTTSAATALLSRPHTAAAAEPLLAPRR